VLILFVKSVGKLEVDGILFPFMPKVIFELCTQLQKRHSDMSTFQVGLLKKAEESVQRRLGNVLSEPTLPFMAAALHPATGHLEDLHLTPAQEDAIWDALKEELTTFPVKTSPYQLPGMQTVHVDQVALLECIRKNIKSK